MQRRGNFDLVYRMFFFIRENGRKSNLYFRVRGPYGERWELVCEFNTGETPLRIRKMAEQYYDTTGNILLMKTRPY